MTRVVDFKELSEYEDGEEEKADFVLVGLFSDEPPEGDEDVFEADDPEYDSLEVEDVGSNVIIFPVDDGEYEENECDNGLNDFGNMILQHIMISITKWFSRQSVTHPDSQPKKH